MNQDELRAKERERKAAWRLANPDKQRAAAARAQDRRWGLRPTAGKVRSPRPIGWRFGLRPGDYDKRNEIQKGLCAICGRVETWRVPRKLAVDHDHLTGIVRGLLCHHCNVGLGYFGDDPQRLRAAVRYISRARAARPDPRAGFDPVI
jgi:hypothetical protein